MTMPYGSTEEPETIVTEDPTYAFHVLSSGLKPGRSAAAEFGSFRTFPVVVNLTAPQGGAVRILNRSLRRHRAFIRVNASQVGAAIPAVTATNEVTNPGAGGIITSISAASLAAAGVVTGTVLNVQWEVSLQGTVTAADANNMRISSPLGTLKENGVFPGVVGNYPQNSFSLIYVTGNDITVTATAAASGAAAIYGAQISATPQTNVGGQPATDGILLASRDIAGNSPPPSLGQGLFFNGGYVPIGEDFRYECQQELWAIPLLGNSALVYVTVLDENYASDSEDWRHHQ